MKTSFDVVTPWQGWPMLYAAYDGGDPVSVVLYSWDAMFRPPEPTQYGVQEGVTNEPYPSGVFGVIDVFDNPSFVPVPGRINHVAGIDLYSSDPVVWDTLRPTNIGGSARPNEPIKGRQYWEVLIVALPNKAPPSQLFDYGMTPLDWGSTIYPVVSNIGPIHSLQLHWPPGLNTWLSPTIGLWPVDPTFGRTNLIGLDALFANVRSIGVTRTSALYDSGYDVSNSADVPPRPQMAIEAQAPIEARFPGLFLNPRLVPGVVKDSYNQGNIVPPDWVGDLFATNDIEQRDYNPWASSYGTAPLPYGGVLPPLGSVLYGAPLIKGRGDQLLAIVHPRDAPNLGIGIQSGHSINVGTYSGVDLGGFGVGDRLMFATDTFLRKFWVGKNGVWHGQDGDTLGPPDGKPSCYLDGLGENYYPGCSTRIGPTTLRFVFGAKDLAYPIPKAFRVYPGAFI